MPLAKLVVFLAQRLASGLGGLFGRPSAPEPCRVPVRIDADRRPPRQARG